MTSSELNVTHNKEECLADLQEAWSCLRDAIETYPLSYLQQALLLHIDTAMSWECVRDLHKMKMTLVAMMDIIRQAKVGDEVLYWVNVIYDNLTALFTLIKLENKKKGDRFYES